MDDTKEVFHTETHFLRRSRITEFSIGSRCRVEPLNPAKKKHAGRGGEIVGVIRDDKVSIFIEAVRVRFDDNNRVGRVATATSSSPTNRPAFAGGCALGMSNLSRALRLYQSVGIGRNCSHAP